MMKLQSKSFGSFQERVQGVVNVTKHEGFNTTQELVAHKESRNRILAIGELVQDRLHSGTVFLQIRLHIWQDINGSKFVKFKVETHLNAGLKPIQILVSDALTAVAGVAGVTTLMALTCFVEIGVERPRSLLV